MVVVAAMVATFLSDADRGRTDADQLLLRAGGTLTRALVPVLRAWRALSGLPTGPTTLRAALGRRTA